METNANHVAVGSVVLLAIAGLVGFVLWLGKAEIDREFSYKGELLDVNIKPDPFFV